MRRALAVTGLVLLPFGAAAEDGSPAAVVPPQASSLSESVPLPSLEEPAMNGYRLFAIAAGAVVGVIAVNYVTGGLISPILAYGSGAAIPPVAAPLAGASAGAVVTFIAVEAAMTVGFTAADLAIASAGPVAIASVGGPVHVALGDGYTTPETLLAAVGTSIGAAGSAAVEIGAHADEIANYLRSTIGNWLTEG